ncbi:MAG: ABC transporter permease [Gemmatimonadaceae bacterium]
MGKFWVVFKREYLERVRTKWFIAVTLFGPIFFATIMVLPGYLSVRGMRTATVGNVVIVDATGSGLGERIVERLRPVGLQSTTVEELIRVERIAPADVAAREDSLIALVQRREITGYLVVDSLTLRGESARYAGRNAGSVGETERIEAAVRAGLLAHRVEAAGLSAEVARSLAQVRVRLSTERITEQGKGGSGLAGAVFGFGIAFLLYMSIILYGQNILRGVLEEKTTRVAEVVVSSVSPETLLAGKVIGVGAVGLTQQFVWVASGIFFWNQRTRIFGLLGVEGMPAVQFPSIAPLVALALVLFFILGYTFYASLFAAVGAMVGSQEEAQQASQPVIMMLIFSIIFVQPVMMNPTGRLAEVMSWLPFSAPIIMPMRMTSIPVPTVEIVGSLAGLALACVAGIWLSARIYRVGLLMYGKRPSLRELGRWIRQG